MMDRDTESTINILPPECTCVLQNKSIAAQGGITAESQEEIVGAALDAIWNVGAVETAQQRAKGVWPIVDMQEVITGLQAETNQKFRI